MATLYRPGEESRIESLYVLACGLHILVQKYSGCIANGVRFHTEVCDFRKKLQNSGIALKENHGDNIIDFFGILTDIIQLDYVKDKSVVLFKCKWYDLGSKNANVRIDGNMQSINVIRLWYKNDLFILAN